MDYVVAGLAIGSGLAIIGFLMREAGLSRRFSLPQWLPELGLVLMGTAVVAWCLTFTSLVTDQPDSTATTLIAAGTIVAFVAGMALLARSIGSRRSRQEGSVAESNVRTEIAVAHALPATSAPPDTSDEAIELLAEDAETEASPDAAARNRQDWEAIWRETWGSNELPRAIVGDQTIASADSDPARQTWAAEPAPVEAEPAAIERDEFEEPPASEEDETARDIVPSKSVRPQSD